MKHLIDWYHFGLDKVNSTVSSLIGIDIGKAEVDIGINTDLLVDPTQALDGAHIEGILAEESTGIESLDMDFFSLFYLSEIPFSVMTGLSEYSWAQKSLSRRLFNPLRLGT
ncbi:MAG: hypothetical protein RBT05_12520 [Bacteroidales bacterium]|jgi:hypothetical protein|nr:hypothetical protein [Bacteroidales bacterium]